MYIHISTCILFWEKSLKIEFKVPHQVVLTEILRKVLQKSYYFFMDIKYYEIGNEQKINIFNQTVSYLVITYEILAT